MKILIALAAVAIATLAGGALFLYSGIYNIAATDMHTGPVYWLLETGMRQSVRRSARAIVVPSLADPVFARRGRALHDEHCVRCHGAPGKAPEEFALGLTPPAANLAHTAREWPPAELYWVIKKGIKMAGMPAWEFRLHDDDLWAIVAYLQVLPNQSPAEYRASAPQAAVPRQVHASAPAAPDPARGRTAILQYACATCHFIPGIVGAQAPVGPPLAGIATRRLIAGMVPNSADNMVRWLQAPANIYPEGAMPNLGVTEQDARDITAYLSTLK